MKVIHQVLLAFLKHFYLRTATFNVKLIWQIWNEDTSIKFQGMALGIE